MSYFDRNPVGRLVSRMTSDIDAINEMFGAGSLTIFIDVLTLMGIVAIIMAHVKRSDAAGTWLASHYRWLIRTFWFSVIWGVVGGIIFVALFIILVGIVIAYAIWIATTIWVLYRLIRGYLLFKDSQPVPGM